MISNVTNVVVENTTTPYPSLLELKETHTRLRRLRSEGETLSLLDEIETFIQRGSATGAILDNDDDRRLTQSYLDYWVTFLYRAKRTPSDATLAEFDPSLAPQLDDSLCPYKGLNAFQETDRNIFFGRERLIEAMTRSLIDRRLLVVVGPSGSGKSSMVLAGLLPALKNGVLSGSEHWQYFPPFVPGSNPLRNLALASRPPDKNSADWITQQTQSLKQDRYHLIKTVQGLGDAPAVIIVDQFEEIFTLCTDDQLRNAFIENLVNLAEASNPKHLVILTLRSDYEPQIVSLPALIPLFERGHARITPLASSDLYQAIEEPAKRVGLRFEDGVADALVKDILGEPAGLPLLQFALLRLWKMRDHNRITWLAYKSLGGARRALALTADEFYNGLFGEDQAVVKRILLRLARPSEGFEVTSNRVRRKTLDLAGDHPQKVDHALNKLVGAGLVRLTRGETAADDQVEVAHEALVRNWPTLVGWLEDERVTLRRRLRLTAAADQWLECGRDRGALLGGALLEEALEYKDLNDFETEFVRVSQATAQQRIDFIVRQVSRTRRLALILAIVALCAMFLAVYAFGKRKEAVANAQTAAKSASDVAAAELKLATEEGRRAITLAEESKKHAVELEAEKGKVEAEKKKFEKQVGIATRAREKEARAKNQEEIAKKLAQDSQKLAEQKQKDAETATETITQFAITLLRIVTVEKDAAVLMTEGRPKEALAKYEQLLKAYENLKDPVGQRNVLTQMAQIYHGQNLVKEENKVRDQLGKLPKSVAEVLRKAAQENRIESAIGEIRDAKKSQPDKYYFRESELNTLGYDLLKVKRVKEAIEVFKLNVEAYPDRFNTYDSLGEAYMMAGEKELAIVNYKKALELNPKSTNAMEKLKQLGAIK